MMSAAMYGRLTGDPKAVTTRSGKAMTVATLAVELQQRDDAVTEFFGLVAFGRQADDLLRLGKGDPMSASGRVQANRYQNAAGEEVKSLQLVVDSIVSAKVSRPGGRKKSPDGAPRDGAPFDDDLNF